MCPDACGIQRDGGAEGFPGVGGVSLHGQDMGEFFVCRCMAGIECQHGLEDLARGRFKAAAGEASVGLVPISSTEVQS